MDQESGWSVIEKERRWLADLLESRDARDWDRPSLCAGWRIRDVAAHVALAPTPPSLGQMLIEGARARGRFHKPDTTTSRSGTPTTSAPAWSPSCASTPVPAACPR